MQPPLQLLEVRERERLHLDLAQVVVAPLLAWLEGHGEGALQGFADCGDGVCRELDRPRRRGDPVPLLQRVEENGGPPLRPPLLTVEEAVLPQLGLDLDPERQARVQRPAQARLVEQPRDVDLELPALRRRRDRQRRVVLRPEGGRRQGERDPEDPERRGP